MSQAPATQPAVTAVTIVEGCIICGLCEDVCPQVFSVKEESAVIRLSAEQFYATHGEKIAQASTECPTGVIQVKRG